jgi:hypothetical protein
LGLVCLVTLVVQLNLLMGLFVSKVDIMRIIRR